MSPNTALKQYQTVNVQAQVLAADPHRLIQMLMEGGLTRLAQARGAIEHNQIALKGEVIGKAIGIIGGLREALDHSKGSDIAVNLDRLYDYMIVQLSKANRTNDIKLVDEVAGLLRELKLGWDAIAP
ncbi:flagellar protein FliS [Pseudomonas duriflava]|uniref:Flagellar secretion chaperone FliS n=1 Tax=Pseudomonas duriflava TaxID=459528 RepID=A0A562PRH2_9PSED|nr:flagellar export chaperone FliS [Pseudomonas duriflava]TWI47044.1 flagellar protein FliS [Pseudomonas duriflava]